MKCLVISLLLSTLSLTIAVPAFDFDTLLPSNSPKVLEVNSLLQALANTEVDQDANDKYEEDGTVADFQAVFNVLAQVEEEKDRQQHNKNLAMVQFLRGFGRMLWRAGKGYLRRKHCTEEEEMRAMLQELTGERGMQEAENDESEHPDGDDKARTELQTLFNALKKVEAEVQMTNSTPEEIAKAEKWWKRIKRWFRRNVKRYVC